MAKRHIYADAADPPTIAEFWAAALGYELPEPPSGFATWDDFNAYLEERCRDRQADVLRGHKEAIGGRLLSVSIWEGPDNRVDLMLSDDTR